MRILITVLLLCISAVVFAQVNTSFRGTLNIYQASGASPNYEIRGIFNDTQGQYTSDSVDVGDVIFILEGSNCARLVVTNIISTTGGIIRADVTDSDAVLVNAPLGNAAILEETPNYGFPTFVDGISNDLLSCIQSHFALQVDDIVSSSGNNAIPGNTQDTVVQVAHGLSLLDPVFVNASGNWILSNISDEDSCHMAIVTEVISADTIVLTYNGLTDQPGHSYLVGRVYFVQDDGTYATTVPTNFINDIAFYVISDSTLYITEQRIVSPMTDLNGIYSGSDTIPSGTIATAGNFQFKGEGNDNYYFSFNPENDNVSMRGDSAILYLGVDGAIIYDNNASKRGLEYAASGYVTQPLSLTTKEYVDSLVSSVEIPDGDKGDIVVSGSGTVWDIDTGVVGANELASTAVTPGSYGNSTNIPTITIDADGRITAAANTAVSTHDPVTVTDGTTIDLTLSTQNITAEVKPESIQASHIDTNAVTTSEIQDGTITTTDLAFTPLQGSGTSGRVPRYTSANTLSDGVLRDDGTLLAIGGATVSGYSFYDYNTGGWRLATGTTAQQPTGQAGAFRYNTTVGIPEYHNGARWNYTAPAAGAFTSTRIPYANANGQLADDADFVWDATNNRLGLSVTPSYDLHIRRGTNAVLAASIENSTNSTVSTSALQVAAKNTTDYVYLVNQAFSSSYTGAAWGGTYSANSAQAGRYSTTTAGKMILYNVAQGGTAADNPIEFHITNNAVFDSSSLAASLTNTTLTTRNITSKTGRILYTDETPALNLTGENSTLTPSFNIYSESNNVNRGIKLFQHSANASGISVIFSKSRGTRLIPAAAQSGDAIGAFSFKAYNGTSYPDDAAYVAGFVSGTVTTKTPISLGFVSGDTTSYNVDFLVHSGGNIGAGASGNGSFVTTVNTPPRQLTVYGEARITDLTTDTPTKVVGADNDGDLSAEAPGFGLAYTGGVLQVDTTQIATQSDLAAIGLTTLFTGEADVTVANTVTETTLIPTGTGTVTLPANFLVAGKTIKIDAWGIWTDDAVPATLELRAELGGTLLCTTGANTMVTSEGGQWHAEIIFTCRSTGVSGTTYSQGELRMSSAVDTEILYWMRRSATNTINTTISNAIDLTATHGTADPDNSITLTNITVTVLN